jgi:hypothetical protein
MGLGTTARRSKTQKTKSLAVHRAVLDFERKNGVRKDSSTFVCNEKLDKTSSIEYYF